MAPEIIDEKPYDHTADLWSVFVNLFMCVFTFFVSVMHTYDAYHSAQTHSLPQGFRLHFV